MDYNLLYGTFEGYDSGSFDAPWLRPHYGDIMGHLHMLVNDLDNLERFKEVVQEAKSANAELAEIKGKYLDHTTTSEQRQMERATNTSGNPIGSGRYIPPKRPRDVAEQFILHPLNTAKNRMRQVARRY